MLSFPRAKASVTVAVAVAWIVAAASPVLADQVRGQQWWLAAMHVTDAWGTSKGSGVMVALLDTGVDPATPDLTDQVITGPDFTQSGRRSGGRYWGIHGTAMASLIAGHGHGPRDNSGIVGVAPQAKILSIRVILEANDPLRANSAVASRQPAAIAAGIRYAATHGAQVVDAPLDPGLVTRPGTGGATAAGGSQAERAAVAFALAKGVTVVAPAGDDGATGDRVNYPAAYPGVISVGAFDRHIIKAPFSSRRRYVALTAAGDGVIAAVPSGKYTTIRSTSAASAMVAGIAALIRSRYPARTPAQVMAALTGSTAFHRQGGRPTGSGFGTADAAGALALAARIRPSAAGPPASPPATNPADAAPPPASTPSGLSLRSTVVDEGVRGFVVFLGVLLALSLIAVARMPRSPARLPDANADEAADVLPYLTSAPASWPAGPLQTGPPDEFAGGQGGYYPETASRLPARSSGSRAPSGGRYGETDDPGPGNTPMPWHGTIRPPAVPGSPPWGPAPKPEGEPPPPRP